MRVVSSCLEEEWPQGIVDFLGVACQLEVLNAGDDLGCPAGKDLSGLNIRRAEYAAALMQCYTTKLDKQNPKIREGAENEIVLKTKTIGKFDALLQEEEWIRAWSLLLTQPSMQKGLDEMGKIVEATETAAPKVSSPGQAAEATEEGGPAPEAADGEADPSGCPADEVGRPQFTTLKNIIDFFAVAGPPDHEVHVSSNVMTDFLQQVTSRIFSECTNPTSKYMTDRDKGLSYLQIHNDSMKVYLVDASKEVRLTFAGQATTTPTKGCLPLCEIWGHKIWMDGCRFKNMSGPDIIPAWAIDVSDNDDDVNVEVKETTFEFEFNWSPGFMGHKKKEVVELTTYTARYVPVKGLKGCKKDSMRLCRADIEGEITEIAKLPKALTQKSNQKTIKSMLGANKPAIHKPKHDSKMIRSPHGCVLSTGHLLK